MGSTQSPQVKYSTPEDAYMDSHWAPEGGNSLGDLDINALAPQHKKTGADWHAIFNPQVQRVLDVDLVHSLQHESVVCCVKFSHDGKYVATGSSNLVRVFSVETGEEVYVLEEPNYEEIDYDVYIRSVCFSLDGQYLATSAEDKIIRVWDIQSKTIRNYFTGHTQEVCSIDLARDGRTMASGSSDRSVRLWDIEEGTNILTLTLEDDVTAVAISPDSQYIAAGSHNCVYIWDIQSGLLLERLEGPDGHRDSVHSIAFSPDGKHLISGGFDRVVKMWELGFARGSADDDRKGGKSVKTFEGHKEFVLSVAQTPDANWVLSGSKDTGVQFWDPKTGTAQLMLRGHVNSVISVAPSPQGGYFATGSGDMRARIWSYRAL